MTVHHLHFDGREYTWPVDVRAAGRIAPWASRNPAALERDLAGMAQYFPHWQLLAGHGGKSQSCAHCGGPVVPTDGAAHCALCGQRSQADSLLWVGHLPVPARPEAKFQRGQKRLRKAGFAETDINGQGYLLVPLAVVYPQAWPNEEPAVRYSRRWLEALRLPYSSGTHHLLSGKACLFNWGEWAAMPVSTLLQQRTVNHVISLLKVAAGQKPEQAFIGRGHHTAGLAADNAAGQRRQR